MSENNYPETSRRLHPLLATAAIVVIIACLVGVAAMTGLLPNSKGANQSGDVAANSANTADPAYASAAGGTQVAAASNGGYATSGGYREAGQPVAEASAPPSPPAAPACNQCGRVESIQQVVHQGQTNGLGVAAGAIVGGILGHQVGSGRGQTVATLAGAVGGGYAGNEVEKNRRQTVGYRVNVQMDDGHTKFFTESNPNNWQVGQRVRDAGGHLEHVS